MSTPAKDPVSVTASPSSAHSTTALLTAMLQVSKHVSDLIFSPASLPHVEVSGQLVPVKIPESWVLTAEDTRRIAEEFIGDNKEAAAALRQQGSCDISYSLPGAARFRVNIFIQRGSHAIVMRAIPRGIPTFGAQATATIGGDRRVKKWHGTGYRPNRLREIIDHGSNLGSYQ